MESNEESILPQSSSNNDFNAISDDKTDSLSKTKEQEVDNDEFDCLDHEINVNDVVAESSKLVMIVEEESNNLSSELGASALVNENAATASAHVQNEPSPLEKLIQKQKLELTMELRRLQFGERPVTSTESKNRLEEFFTSALNTEQTTSTRDPTQFRSDTTRSEIESLNSRGRVSHILNTVRDRLENTLQRFVDTTAARRPRIAVVNVPNVVPTASVIPPPPPNIAQSAAYANGLQASQNSIHSSVSSNIVIQSTDGSTNVLQPVTAWVPVVAPQPGQPVEQAPWLARPENLFNAIENVRRQQIIDDISELVHQQLVTSSLESAFRQTLEQRVLERLQNSGTDGDRTRNFVRNISQTNRVERNDFSHLGIFDNGAGRNDDNLDSASTYQPANQRQQQQQTQQNARQSTIHSREIRTLHNEISELKNMMKLSFELQLDMQRSLRQEVAALIAGTLVGKDSNKKESKSKSNQRAQAQAQQPQRSSILSSNQPSNEGQCLICTEGRVDTVFYKCGHMCACYTCSMRLKQTSGNCPVCRAPINDIIRTYKCNME